MPERSVIHSTFTIERTYPQAPARVFAAWADPATKGRWFGGGTDESPSSINMDFRVGGHEASHSEPGADFTFAFDATYHDIVPDERIVFSYDLALGGALVSVSLATVELRAASGDTQLTYTEHGALTASTTRRCARRARSSCSMRSERCSSASPRPPDQGIGEFRPPTMAA